MITYSLQNLLLDDPQLDHESLLGPVVRMRWISNLLRLAVLEEADQLRAAAGEYTEHDAEIRRLRRASMAPDAGRYYPVEGKANQVFKQLDPEQARHILEHWRARQPIPDVDDPESDYLAEQPPTPERRGDDDPESACRVDDDSVEYPDEEDWTESASLSDNRGPVEGSFVEGERTKNQTPNTKNQTLFCPTKHQTQGTKHQTHPNRTARFATDVALALLGALLLAAATWFIQARIQTTAAQPPPALSERSESNGPDITSTTKIVPSAIPKHQTQNTKHETQN